MTLNIGGILVWRTHWSTSHSCGEGSTCPVALHLELYWLAVFPLVRQVCPFKEGKGSFVEFVVLVAFLFWLECGFCAIRFAFPDEKS